MTTFRLTISGDPNFVDYDLLKQETDKLLSVRNVTSDIIVVCAARKGAEMLGERYAAERGYEVAEFAVHHAIDSLTANSAERLMAEFSDHSLVFWDGRNRFTKKKID